MTDTVYKSRIGGLFWLIPLLMILTVTTWILVRPGWIATIVCILFLAVLVYITVASVTVYGKTSYTVTEDSVRIDSPDGILNILFSKITSVDTERDNDALYYGMSRDVVRINFGSSSSVVISPKQKYEFMTELRVAGLNVEE